MSKISFSSSFSNLHIFTFSNSLSALRRLDFLEEVAGEDEVVQSLVLGLIYGVFRALPFHLALFEEDDMVANLEDGVHVVRVDDGADIVFGGDLVDELVYDERRLGVETRVRLVAEQIFGVHRDGSCDGYAFLHTAGNLGWREVPRMILDIDATEAEFRPIFHLFDRHIGEHLQRKHHVFQHAEGVEEGGTLEEHAHLAAKQTYLLLFHVRQVSTVIFDAPRVYLVQTDDGLHQDGLARTGLTDDHVALTIVHVGIDIVQNDVSVKTLMYVFYVYHYCYKFKITKCASPQTTSLAARH